MRGLSFSRGGNTTPLQEVGVVVQTRELAKQHDEVLREFRRYAVTFFIFPPLQRLLATALLISF